MSLADLTMMVLIALSTVIWEPALKPILVGACATALGETVSRVSSDSLPAFTAFSVT